VWSEFVHRKKLASVGASNQVFFVVTKSTGTASLVSAPAKLAARVVANILPPSIAKLAAIVAANSNDAVTIYVSMATWIRIQDGHLFYQTSSKNFSVYGICMALIALRILNFKILSIKCIKLA
jgi:hypothetical protein